MTKYYYCYETKVFSVFKPKVDRENNRDLHIIAVNESEVRSLFVNYELNSNKVYRHALCEKVYKLMVENSEVQESATLESVCRSCGNTWKSMKLLEA